MWPNGSLHHLYGKNVQERLTYIVAASNASLDTASNASGGGGGGGGGVVFEPRFTSMGFRYVELSGSSTTLKCYPSTTLKCYPSTTLRCYPSTTTLALLP